MNINEKQNNETNLKRLAAQRQLYILAKRISYFQFIYYTIFIILFSILYSILPVEYRSYILLCSICFTILDKCFFTNTILRKKMLAAKIQEEFDCDVLEIPWNSSIIEERPPTTMVNEYSLKYLKINNSYDELKNWYPASEKFCNSSFEKIICQKTNCWWDNKLKKNYALFLISLFSLFLIILTIILIKNNTGIRDILILLMSTLIPSISYLYGIVKSNYDSCCNLEKLNERINKIVSNLRKYSYNEKTLNKDVREIQNIIFDNRAKSIITPEWLYKITKNTYESVSYVDNEELSNIIHDFEKNKKTR